MDFGAIFQLLLQALPLLLGPLVVWAATALVTKFKPTLTGKQILVLVVPFLSFLTTVVAYFVGVTVNPFILLFLNTIATFIHEVVKEWQKDAEVKALAAQPK